MSSLIGEFSCKLDDKGRLKLPAELKRKVVRLGADTGDQFVVKRGFETCLELFPAATWEKLRSQVERRINPFNPDHRTFRRQLLDGLRELTLDASDRLLLPGMLLDYAGISGEVVLVGQFDRIEIWQPAKHRKALEGDGRNFSDLAAEVMGDFRSDDL